MSYLAKVIKTSSVPIHYFWGSDSNGAKCYWFIKCSKEKFTMLKSRIGQPGMDLENYGQVVASGYGTTPSQYVKDKLIREFDFNPDEHFTYN